MNPVQDQNLAPEQFVQLTRAMIAVASVDGISPAEAGLIRDVYDAARTDAMPTADALIESQLTASFDGKALADCTPEFANTVVLMCLMAAYADGDLSDAERALVQTIARQVGIDDQTFAALLASVHDDLIGALSGLPDSGSVAKVLKSL